MVKTTLGLKRAAILFVLFSILNPGVSIARAQPDVASSHEALPARSTAAIPVDKIGAVAGKQYSGNGLAVASCQGGAKLHCVFQRLDAHATSRGLWLVSTKDGANGEPFRVVARSLNRDPLVMASRRDERRPQRAVPTIILPTAGKVEVAGHTVRFTRPDLVEEYSVSIDGFQQEFLIEQKPPGEGQVSLELEVNGAMAERMAGGARLVLADSGRLMVYNRLKVVDARGKQLKARMEVLSKRRLAVILNDAGAVYPVRIDPTFSDANWISLGGVPGAGGIVYAVALDAVGNLYIGGDFITAGNALAEHIAEWNGSSWLALGVGLNNTVQALAISGTNLYVGGYFTTATNSGGAVVNVDYIAQWNGRTWSALSSGMNNAVSALAMSGGNLFAGGAFSRAGGSAASSAAEWNGTVWSPLGSGVSGEISALAVSGGNLYAGGVFTTAGGNTVNNVAEWNGTTWSALGRGVNSYVYALAVSSGILYVGGNFTTVTNNGGAAVSANYIAQWNGTSWSALGSGMDYDVNALAISGGDLYAGGNFFTAGGNSANCIAKWNGSSWSALGSGMSSQVFALAVSGGDLYAGGNFFTAGGIAAESIARWNGTSWSGFGSGMNEIVLALAVSGNTLYAGGAFTSAGRVAANCIAQWNGTSWSALGQGITGVGLDGGAYVAALAVSGSTLLVGGDFTSVGNVSANYIAEWNGSKWSALGPGMNDAVDALAVSAGNVYAGGSFTTAGGNAAYRIAQWDGSSWSAMGTGMNGQVNALLVSGGNVYAGGGFTASSDNTVTYNYVAEWNGANWSPLGQGMSSFVSALAVSGTNLYVGGDFITATESAGAAINVNYIAEWNGSSWAGLGSGMNGDVDALAVSGTNLYAGGNFTTVDGNSANNIAEWNGSGWSALGSGMDGPNSALNTTILAMALVGSDLYVGGDFYTAGDQASAYIAEAILMTPVTLSLPAHLAGGRFQMLLDGVAKQNYTLQMSTNLSSTNWSTLYITNNPATNSFLILDPNATNQQGFYRILVGP